MLHMYVCMYIYIYIYIYIYDISSLRVNTVVTENEKCVPFVLLP